MRRLQLAVALIASCCAALTSCTIGPGFEDCPEPATVTVTETVVSAPVEPAPGEPAPGEPAPVGDLESELKKVAEAAVASYGGGAAVALSNGAATVTSGDDRDYVAWSTIKVPIAVAALNADASLQPVAEAAITISDNLAAETLWSAVSPADVEQVLAGAGVQKTVNAVVTRPGFTAFGQTVMSTAEEATFAAGLPCVAGSAPVLDMMGRVTPDQAYGLGQLAGAQFKGGWGPDESGSYVLRQFALVGGRGVALTAAPADGTYATAQHMATQMALALPPLLESMPPASCSPNQ